MHGNRHQEERIPRGLALEAGNQGALSCPQWPASHDPHKRADGSAVQSPDREPATVGVTGQGRQHRREVAPLQGDVAIHRHVALERRDFAAVLPSLARDTDCRRLSIRGLDRAAVGALVRVVAGRPLGAGEGALVAGLERETAGNPFFLMAIAMHLSEVGMLDQDVFRLGEQLAEIPESVRDLVRWRVGRLSDGCAETLSVASVLGERFDAAVLGVIAGLDDATTVDVLEEAAGAGLIAEIRDEPDWWWFSHSLTRRVILEGLSASRRTRLHQRIGNVLESRPKTSPAEVAHHFRAAASLGTAGKAVRYELMAARRALSEVAAEVALRHFTHALELHE